MPTQILGHSPDGSCVFVPGGTSLRENTRRRTLAMCLCRGRAAAITLLCSGTTMSKAAATATVAVRARSTAGLEGMAMPAEWASHELTLMAWPTRLELWGDSLGEA